MNKKKKNEKKMMSDNLFIFFVVSFETTATKTKQQSIFTIFFATFCCRHCRLVFIHQSKSKSDFSIEIQKIFLF